MNKTQRAGNNIGMYAMPNGISRYKQHRLKRNNITTIGNTYIILYK